MDVDRILASAFEPSTSRRLQVWVKGAQARLSPEQRTATERWVSTAPFEAGAMQALRTRQLDARYLRALAERLERRRLTKEERFAERAAPIARLFDLAPERPILASTLVWHSLGATAPKLASALIHVFRERAGLPGLRRSLDPKQLPARPDSTWFEDRQFEDAAEWAEYIPAPRGSTLAEAITRVEQQRTTTGATITELVPFIQRTASFLQSLSRRSIDPIGFALAQQASLIGDPPLAKRFEVASWGRTVGRTLCLRGQMMIMTIAVQAPWPLAVEVIASELGRGVTGAFGILMRLRGEMALPSTLPAPVMLCLPGEEIEQRGARFERWSQRAYPHAVDAWRAFA